MNPFTPTVGQAPIIFAESNSRKQLLSDFQDVFNGNMHNPSRMSFIMGIEGIGKTAILSQITTRAYETGGWIVAHTNCGEWLLEDIIKQTTSKATEYLPEKAKARLTALSVGPLGGVEWEYPDSHVNYPNWRNRFSEILDLLQAKDIGVLITVDEAYDFTDLASLITTFPLFIQENRKIALAIAGKYENIEKMLTSSSISFTRRTSTYKLERLSNNEVRRVLGKTVEIGGKRITEEALDKAVEMIDGFPYMLQLLGFHIWEKSGICELITSQDVEDASAIAKPRFEDSIYQVIVDALTDQEQRILELMLQDEEETNKKRLCEEEHLSRIDLNQVVRRLIDKGVIEQLKRGYISFAFSGFREYLLEIWYS